MTVGSQQLRMFRIARRDGASIEDAAEIAGMPIAEAQLTARADDQDPPPPEAFELLYDPTARIAAPETKETDMGRPKKMARETEQADAEAGEGSGISGEYSRPDAAKAFDIYDKQIAPKLTHISTLKGDLSQPWDDVKQHANFPKKILAFILVLEAIEDDAKRDHNLLALAEGLRHRKLFLPRDLVTMAAGEDGGDIIPTGEVDDDALGALEDDDFDEADEDELAAQEGRGKPAAGTGAAAIDALKKSAAAEASAVTH